ncbi:hypothetical protein Sango_1880000 [Sesamum angolense]|uniref:Uncharacterized protein n=1 Tax=Sesamum angolense TaxID=2727404 RepID=A0AAE1WJ27_9LAMI|nr:hypothetical protein Sango_1880000 [Sesamum angolense]
MGYQLPELQQFDGRGNLKQHIANFIKTCNNANTDGDILVKQLIRLLKGNTFNWVSPRAFNSSWRSLIQPSMILKLAGRDSSKLKRGGTPGSQGIDEQIPSGLKQDRPTPAQFAGKEIATLRPREI